MVNVFDVPAEEFIEGLARYIKESMPEVVPPDWARVVKSGAHVERIPPQNDFWYIRSASLLRKIYLEEPVGIERLRAYYGGRKKGKGRRPEHFKKAGGSIIGEILKQLGKAGLVEVQAGKGRTLTAKGRGTMDKIAVQIKRDLESAKPELKKYR